MKLIDNFLNNITMYRLVLYYLIFLWNWALILSFFGLMPFDSLSLIFSTLFVLLISWVTNKIFAIVFNSPTNLESIYISSLILVLIIAPLYTLHDLPFIFWCAIWISASKFIFAYSKRHFFNPVAFSILLTGLFINGSANWWVGTSYMLFPVLLGGLLVIKKIRRWDLTLSFFFATLPTIIVLSVLKNSDYLTLFQKIFLDSPIIFFAFLMLTEPQTSPPTKTLRMIYGLLIGFLFSPQVHIGGYYTTPEMALIVGNIFSFIVSPKEKLVLFLKQKIQLSSYIYDFVFGLEKSVAYSPGQYMEWTLSYPNPDSRGNRRYFTLASSPTEDTIRLGVRFNEPSSSFKKQLMLLSPGSKIVAGSLSGDFTLPDDPNKKLVFIAGGIGVTPFRSMIKFLIDKNEKRQIIILYSVKNLSDAVYLSLFKEAYQKLGIKTVISLTDLNNIPSNWQGRKGIFTKEVIMEEIPDFNSRLFYLSGPHLMVSAFEKTLADLDLKKSQIKTDYFPGYA